MNTPRTPWLPGFALMLALSGCVTQLKGVVRANAGAEHGYQKLDGSTATDAVRITRDGTRLADPLNAHLQKGDIIQTGADVSALLRFADGNKAILAPNTQVRLGSLEVIFGRIFASVRGQFVTRSDTVSAEVEGTEYLFERQPGGGVRVLVLEGVVRCRSLQSRWADARVNAGRLFEVGDTGLNTPRVTDAPADLLLGTRRWVDAVLSTATPRFSLPIQLNIGIGVGGFGGGRRSDAPEPPRETQTID